MLPPLTPPPRLLAAYRMRYAGRVPFTHDAVRRQFPPTTADFHHVWLIYFVNFGALSSAFFAITLQMLPRCDCDDMIHA